MSRNILILGASYGSLLGIKLVMAGHDVTLVCRKATASLFNTAGAEVRIKLRGEDAPRTIRSDDHPGALDAVTPDQVDLSGYDMVALAMSEPQYATPEIRALMGRIAASGLPCLSIMNMPPLPYLARIQGLDVARLREAFNCPEAWDGFEPGRVSLCSPDPQAYRAPGEPANILHVGLPTNFKAAPFEDPAHTDMLHELERDIAAIRLDGQEVPVKLRVFDSLFVPFAKWSMLLTGNYRCVLNDGVQPIRDAVHGDLGQSQAIYALVDQVVSHLGGDAGDAVPFEKYAKAAQGLLKPSSAARAIDGGAAQIERVDRLVRLVARQVGMAHPALDQVVGTVDVRLAKNAAAALGTQAA